MAWTLDDLDTKSKKTLNEIRDAYRRYSTSSLAIFMPPNANEAQIEAACSRAAQTAREMIAHEHRYVENLLVKLTEEMGPPKPKC